MVPGPGAASGGSSGHDVPRVALDDPLEARVLVAGNEQVAPVEVDERVELVRGDRDHVGAVVPQHSHGTRTAVA